MFNQSQKDIAFFIIFVCLMIFLLVTIVVFIVFIYKQKQNTYLKGMKELKMIHENDMLRSQLEIQEQTFQNISREIHDNIGQKLSLAKLHLNTLHVGGQLGLDSQIKNIVNFLTETIADLSDLSRSMSSDVIKNNGFLKALEFEINQLNKPELFNIKLTVVGEPVFMHAEKELILFRIVQESLNNVIKHAHASSIHLNLHYADSHLLLSITDNGKGFSLDNFNKRNGLLNMNKRALMLNGQFDIESSIGTGTVVTIKLPLYENS